VTEEMVISNEIREQLTAAACEARTWAYAPYSRFLVGAAVLADDGQIYSGVNIENASYGLTVCAERTAVGTMVTNGGRKILAVAVCTEHGVTPCGACRQVLNEFVPQEGDMPVILVNARGHTRETTLSTLLPDNFGPRHLDQD
jgi:cytidine deaminase